MKNMKGIVWLHVCVCMFVMVLGGSPAKASNGKPAEQKTESKEKTKKELSLSVSIPLFSSRFDDVPLALVDDEPITVREVEQSLAQAHTERTDEKSGRKLLYTDILNRLITTRLIAHEARNMGLDELSEVKELIDAYQRQYLRTELITRATESVKGDKAEEEKRYQELAREYKVKSALFPKEEAAKKAVEEVTGGKDFDETIKKSIDSQQATGTMEEKYLNRRELLPEVAQVVTDMKPGTVQSVRIERGFVVLKLVDARVPEKEDATAREQARQESERWAKNKAAIEFKLSLMKKYAKLNEKLFNKLDYEASDKAFSKYEKDQRALAEIKGEKPVTVADLTEAIGVKLYHGTKSAYDSRSINEKKVPMLNEILGKRLELKEIREQGLDKTPESRAGLKEIENSVLFDAFIQKAVIPDLHPVQKDLTDYYESHRKDYTRPKMMKLSSVPFKDRKHAEAAVRQLRGGTDMKWVRANADGIADDAPEVASPNFPILVSNLPEGLQKAVDSVRPGDYTVYSAPGGIHYAVFIAQVIPEQIQPFNEVSEKIKGVVFGEQIKKSLDTWAAKLRDAYPVTVFLKESER